MLPDQIQEAHHPLPLRLRMEEYIRALQKTIIAALEKVDGTSFGTDEWQRPDGGGGVTRVLQEGNVFEKGGVNISIVHGTLSKSAVETMRANHKNLAPSGETQDIGFHALGLSIILHPRNPMVPSVHMNCRYFETVWPDGKPQTAWFGGGSDLSPSYLFNEDATHFHQTLKNASDQHDKEYYPRFKKWCDEYFNNTHRGERRGIGGIFFDDLDEEVVDSENGFAFVKSTADAFLPAYLPIVEKRKDTPFNNKEKEWQEIRRGRYAEFSLVHDRGTAFGLRVPGSRVESILISLPLTARWSYMYEPETGSREQTLLEILKNPREWV
jgi:coproporphyrinogen III oxidase